VTTTRRILLLGGTGQVGRALQARWQHTRAPWEVLAPTSRELSLEHPAPLADAVRAMRPSAVVNCAAYTRVDDAEGEPARARVVNAESPGVLAEVAAKMGARLVQLSTDYVFDGRGGAPYAPQAPTNPLSVYGRTKREGEMAVLAAHPAAVVLRTAWVHSRTPPNFVATAVRRLREGATMRVVDDQVGTPTRAATLARVVDGVLAAMDGASPVAGIVHATDAGVASWYDVACAVRERLLARGDTGPDALGDVLPVPGSEVSRPAPRPTVAVLNCHATWEALQFTPPHWRTGVGATVDELLGEAHG
jgi:dTDP-4-dehydrorhamnose reductase